MLALIPLTKEVTYIPTKVNYLEQDWCADLLTAGSVSMSLGYVCAACLLSFRIREYWICCHEALIYSIKIQSSFKIAYNFKLKAKILF